MKNVCQVSQINFTMPQKKEKKIKKFLSRPSKHKFIFIKVIQ